LFGTAECLRRPRHSKTPECGVEASDYSTPTGQGTAPSQVACEQRELLSSTQSKDLLGDLTLITHDLLQEMIRRS
jgi:hypothetical protein